MSKVETKTVEISDEALDNLLGVPGAESVMTPNEEIKKVEETGEQTGFFSKKPEADVSYLDDLSDEEIHKEDEEEDDDKAKGDKKPESKEVTDEDLDKLVSLDDEENTIGDSPLSGLADITKELIESEVIFGFEDDKDISEYTAEDFKELFKTNFEEQKKSVKESTPKEFYESLPEELQYAAKYVADGGTDLKGLFKALATSEESKSLDITQENGQKQAIRDYLTAKQFGDSDMIEEQIEEWDDLGHLEKKAKAFKPKLDEMSQVLVKQRVAEQEAKTKKREDASKRYTEDVYNTLNVKELNGVALPPKIQAMLYEGLTSATHNSMSGNKTNMFGHLIEKHQYIEPNHALIAEALWLLKDPEGYKKQITKGITREVTKETVKKLKTAQSSNDTNSKDTKLVTKGRRQINRPGTEGFFKR